MNDATTWEEFSRHIDQTLLDDEVFERIQNAVADPPQPNAALRAAAKRLRDRHQPSTDSEPKP